VIRTANGTDYKSAPEDYAALHRTYFPYMVNLVAKHGINENNKEDVASEIFVRFMERGFLEQFNPDLVFEYEGEQRPAKFKSFLSRAVTTYVRGYYDKQKRLANREAQICDVVLTGKGSAKNGFQPSGQTSGSNPQSWADQYGPPTDDHAEKVMDLMVEEQDYWFVRDYLMAVKPRNSHDLCDLVALYDAVRAHLLVFGEYDVRDLEKAFGVSNTTMHNWLWWLRANIAELYGRELPPKRRRTPPRKAGS
jgi:DNA-directed RNA polymerase specialized sigma24 family protein